MGYYDFPRTRDYDSDLGWLIRKVKENYDSIQNIAKLHQITYANPLEWDITKQYPMYQIVLGDDGNAYLSAQPVPKGIELSNSDYWIKVFNYDAQIQDLKYTIETVNKQVVENKTDIATNTTNIDFINNDIADLQEKTSKLLTNLESQFYNFEITKGYDYYTNYTIIKVPKNVFAKGETKKNNKGTYNTAKENVTSLTFNSSLSIYLGDSYKEMSVIGNGQVLHEFDVSSYEIDNSYVTLGVFENGDIIEYQTNSLNVQSLINAGVKNTLNGFFKIVNNGVAAILPSGYDDLNLKGHPRQVIGIDSSGNVLLLTCDARTVGSKGLNMEECQTLMINAGAIKAWNLDGGGSTSTVYHCNKLNLNIDSNGTYDRHIGYSYNIPNINGSNSITDNAISAGESDFIRQQENNTILKGLSGYNQPLISNSTYLITASNVYESIPFVGKNLSITSIDNLTINDDGSFSLNIPGNHLMFVTVQIDNASVDGNLFLKALKNDVEILLASTYVATNQRNHMLSVFPINSDIDSDKFTLQVYGAASTILSRMFCYII